MLTIKNLPHSPARKVEFRQRAPTTPEGSQDGELLLLHWLPVESQKANNMGRKMADPRLGPEAEYLMPVDEEIGTHPGAV